MSDHIPFEIQVEIIKRLPVKSLIRFRSMSKPWKSLIDSSDFTADYKVHDSQPQRLLVSYIDREDSEVKCVLIDDDDTFPQRKCSLNVPLFINKSIKEPKMIGSSHGLLCLYGYYRGGDLGLSIIWNPSIRKSLVIKVPNELRYYAYKCFVCFGVCPNTKDPKLVKINSVCHTTKLEDISCIPFQVEVFTLSSRAWRIPLRNLPRQSISFVLPHIVIDGCIYWLAYDTIGSYCLIISFDLTSGEFSEIYFPDYLSKQYRILSISKLKDSLVVFENSGIGFGTSLYSVWMMEHGVPNSFRKLFSFDAPNLGSDRPLLLGLRENGEALLQTYNWDKKSVAVKVYEPSSKHIKDLGFYAEGYSFFASSYIETLFLLDQPDSSMLF